MKVIIAGSRGFNNYKALKGVCDHVLSDVPYVEIVSGGAKGADSLGERYAKEKGHSLKKFPADWDNQGKKAGILRNIDMAKYADGLIAFWDGTSKGTEHMIETAKSLVLKLVVYDYR